MAIVLFGATGYTGELTARALVARGQEPVLAARTRSRLDALAAELGDLETRVADVARPDSVRALVRRGDVLVSTVGPFARWGRPALDAAIGAGAHYVDSTGETQFIRSVFEDFGPGAEAAGCGLLTAMGYDYVPGNLAGGLALREAGPDAVRVEIGYFTTGAFGLDGTSGGTKASAAGVMLDPSFAWRGGRLVTERGAARRRGFARPDGRVAKGISVGASEHFALPRVQPGLRDVEVVLGAPGQAIMPALSLATAGVTRLPGARDALKGLAAKAIRGSTGGPDAAARKRSGTMVFAEARSPAGDLLASVRLEGANVYDFTAGILAWAAETASAGGLRGTGALGPVDGYGLDALQAGAAEAGLHRVA